jgi:hypothetical protein
MRNDAAIHDTDFAFGPLSKLCAVSYNDDRCAVSVKLSKQIHVLSLQSQMFDASR